VVDLEGEGLMGGGSKTISQTDQVMAGMEIQQSTYGAPLTVVYGTNRVAPNLIYYQDFTPIPHTTSQSAGKGGGGTTMTQTTYTYTAAIILALGRGPIVGVGAIWADKEIYRDSVLRIKGDPTSRVAFPAMEKVGGVLFLGSLGQEPWSYVSSKHPSEALPYSGVAYVAFPTMDLGNSAHMKNYGFEVKGGLIYGSGIVDANPKDAVQDFMVNLSGFPVARVGDWTTYSAFCQAQGIFLSPVFSEKRPASEALGDIFVATNSAPVWSGNVLKIIPYADQSLTGDGILSFGTYTPDPTPLYDLTDDDYLREGEEDPIKVTRSTPADAWNQVVVEFRNRARDYNIETVEAKDSANIEAYGLRTADPIKLHCVTTASVAQVVAQQILQRKLYIRNSYELRLGWKYALLEPMDPITLTDAALGLKRYLVRVTEVEENEYGDLTVKAEDWPLGGAMPPRYGSQTASGYIGDFNVDPGNINAPIIMEPYFQQTAGKLELWIAASGGALWGQSQVWVSLDGNSYTLQGDITAPARQGVLSGTMNAASAAGLDTATTVPVDTTLSRTQILSGSDADLAAYSTLCFCGGEWFAYRDSALGGVYNYVLTRLQRGLFGSGFGAHAAASPFLRVDPPSVFRFPLREDQVGKTLYIKFASRNVYGGGQQALADVDPYTYVIKGTALNAPPSDVANLTAAYQAAQAVLQWDPVVDYRAVDYEVRKGPTWGSAQVLGRTPVTRFPANGSGTYWVAARYGTTYSINPASLVLSGALVQNVVQTWDEQATGWAGTFGGGAANVSSLVQLTGAGTMISSLASISGVTSLAFMGVVAASGTYTVPGVHEVDVTTVQPCTVTANWTSYTADPYSQISTKPSIAAIASIVGNVAGKGSVGLQIAVSDGAGVYGAWQNFIPGTYSGRKFKMQAVLTSTDTGLTQVLSTFTWTVDVPDRAERGTGVSLAAGGTAVSFTRAFQQVPNVQVTITNAVAGDDIFFTAGPSTSGFTVQVKNGGTGVARTVNWFAQGY
jgi:hypothetical protein